jgi:hypothetical protein
MCDLGNVRRRVFETFHLFPVDFLKKIMHFYFVCVLQSPQSPLRVQNQQLRDQRFSFGPSLYNLTNIMFITVMIFCSRV